MNQECITSTEANRMRMLVLTGSTTALSTSSRRFWPGLRSATWTMVESNLTSPRSGYS